jgi:hypothetical protein
MASRTVKFKPLSAKEIAARLASEEVSKTFDELVDILNTSLKDDFEKKKEELKKARSSFSVGRTRKIEKKDLEHVFVHLFAAKPQIRYYGGKISCKGEGSLHLEAKDASKYGEYASNKAGNYDVNDVFFELFKDLVKDFCYVLIEYQTQNTGCFGWIGVERALPEQNDQIRSKILQILGQECLDRVRTFVQDTIDTRGAEVKVSYQKKKQEILEKLKVKIVAGDYSDLIEACTDEEIEDFFLGIKDEILLKRSVFA